MASGIGSMFNEYAQNLGTTVRNNPRQSARAAGALFGLPAIAAGAGIATYQTLRQRDPERLGSQIGAGFDTAGQPTEALQRGMNNWDEQQWQQYQNAAQETFQNQVRLGQITPEQAQQRMNQMNFTFNQNGQGSIGGITNSGQLQQSAMQSLDRPGPEDYTAMYGNPSSLGVEEQQYWDQVRNMNIQQGSLQQDLADMALSREYDRTMNFRRKVERDRNYEQFAMGEAQQKNQMRRAMAQGLMNSYVNTAQALITSGL